MWFLRNFCGGEHRSLLCGSIGPSSVFGSCAINKQFSFSDVSNLYF